MQNSTVFGFSAPDVEALREALVLAYPSDNNAPGLLRRIGFREIDIPSFEYDRIRAWNKVFADLRGGVVDDPFRTVLREAWREFAHNPVFIRLGIRYLRSVLVIGASPDTATPIQPDAELRGIRERVGEALDVSGLTTAQALAVSEVRKRRPYVLHLACHSRGGDLLFERPDGQEDPIAADRLVAMLAAYRDQAGAPLHAVVLNCCYGAGFARLFAGVAEVVVAHRGELDDECAAIFAAHLYAAFVDIPDVRRAARIAAAEAAAAPYCSNLPDDLIVLPDRAR